MRDLRVKYRATVVSTVTFQDADNAAVDPEIVTCYFNDAAFTGTQLDVGVYQVSWLADTPGIFKRVWVGRSEDNTVYLESKPLWINVAEPEVT